MPTVSSLAPGCGPEPQLPETRPRCCPRYRRCRSSNLPATTIRNVPVMVCDARAALLRRCCRERSTSICPENVPLCVGASSAAAAGELRGGERTTADGRADNADGGPRNAAPAAARRRTGASMRADEPPPAAAAACAAACAVAKLVCAIVAAIVWPLTIAVALIVTAPVAVGASPVATAWPAALVVNVSVEAPPANDAPCPPTLNVTATPETGRLLRSRTSTIGLTAVFCWMMFTAPSPAMHHNPEQPTVAAPPRLYVPRDREQHAGGTTQRERRVA